MESQVLNILAYSAFAERAKLFFEKYDLKNILVTGDSNYSKRSLQKSTKRTCRFCNKEYPEVNFFSYSHLLPQLMGNSNLYSDFECDQCNSIFSSFENDLANFLGISRSILGLSKEKSAPGFVDRKLSAKSRSFIGDNILIIAPEDLEKKGRTTNIKYTKNSFIPSNVYKALLKSALSIIDNKTVSQNYKYAIQYLAGNGQITKGAFVSGYKLSFQLNLPLHVFLFEKKIKADKIPTHIVVFNFQNNIISLPVPLHQEDISFYNSPYDVPVPPPYFTNQQNMEIAIPISYLRDFSSNEKIIDEEEIITLKMDPESLKNVSSYDPSTDQFIHRPYEQAPIKYLIITRDGITVDPKIFSAFIREQTKEF